MNGVIKEVVVRIEFDEKWGGRELDDDRKARLTAAGYRETTVQELFGLSDEEIERIEERIKREANVKPKKVV